MKYKKRGFSPSDVSATLTLIVGMAVATLVLIFTGSLGGQTYNLVEPDINNITDATIKGYVQDGITSAFKAQKTTGDYLPLIVLAAVIGLVLTMVLSFGGSGYRGGAL